MSSFRKFNINKYSKFTLLSPGKDLIFHHIYKIISDISVKRISYLFSLNGFRCRASMAVEAAIAIPFFLFFIVYILFSFDALRLHGNLMAALHQTGNEMAFYGYAYGQINEGENLLPAGVGSFLFSEVYARNKVIDYLGKDYLDHTCLTAGSDGLHFLKSSVMEDGDIIELTASYRVGPFIKIFGFSDFPMENRYYGRAWTGYDVENRDGNSSEEDPVVYVAETGTVYHISRGCTYLNPSIEAVPHITIDELRNESGEKYTSCNSCARYGFQALAYITTHGNRVHGSLSCSGLKRTIYTIRLSEAQGKGRCTKCG